ncbi:MAG: chalcone isomerase family protein [Flavobacteriaceae bacterium]
MKNLAFILIFFLSLTMQAQMEVGDINLPAVKTNEIDKELNLNGAGIREKFWMDLYVGSMYVVSKNESAEFYCSSQESVLMKLNIVSNLITSEKMFNAINEGFENSAKNPNAELAKKIDLFKNLFTSEEIIKGDTFTFSFVPSKGTYIYKNDTEISLLEGNDFQKALFGIWLGEKPADKNLKKNLLGN